MCPVSMTQLPHNEPQEVDENLDLDDVIQNTHNLLRLAKPILQIAKTTDSIRRWEPWSVCLVILGVCNCACFFLDGFYVVFSLLVVLLLAGLGYAHRQTNILAKVLPTADIDSPRGLIDNTPTSDSQRDLVQSEMLEEFKFLLSSVNTVTRALMDVITRFYAIIKWENFNHSLWCFIFLFTFTILIHVIPVRWTVTLLVDIFLLHYPFYQYFLVVNNMWGSVAAKQEPQEISMFVDMESDTESIAANLSDDRDLDSCLADDEVSIFKGGTADSAEEADTGEKSEGGSSSDEAAEMRVEMRVGSESVQFPQTEMSGINNKGKRPGMVGKILKTVKNQAVTTGSCAGCNVNFMTLLKRRRLCSHCGNHFCIRCCSYKVTRSMFGATAPAAQTETVYVCFYCFNYLNKIYRSRGGSRSSLNGVGGTAGGTASKANGQGNGGRKPVKTEGAVTPSDTAKEKTQ